MKHSIKIILAIVLLSSTVLHAQSYPEMIAVSGGTFTMGNVHGLNEINLQPPHKVIVNNYSIGKTEVTVAQYKTYCNATGVKMPKEPSWGRKDNDPIVNVNWHDASFYCEWLTAVKGEKYSLPTEAQWEFAARGGNNSRGYFSGGNSILFVGWFKGNSGSKSHTVASKKPNKLGVYDMSGNVREWCLDLRDISSYENNSLVTKKRSVLRGGCRYDKKSKCRIPIRFIIDIDYRRNSYGFRVVSF